MSETGNAGARDLANGASSGPNRYVVIALLFATYFLTYLDRAAMATAIPFVAKEFGLSSVAAGSVLSAFFFGYALMQIPSGILVDKFRPSRLLVTAIVLWSIFTAATGLVHSLLMMIVVRVLFGLSEGPAPAAVSKTIATSFARDQIGRWNGFVIAATLLGSAAAPGFVAAIVVHWGWRAAFLSLLLPGLLLALAIHIVLGRSSAQSVGQDSVVPAARADGNVDSAWKTILASSKMRWCVVTTFLSGFANWGLQNWLPTYFLEARGFSVAEMGLSASVPYAAGALGYMLGGYAGDRVFPDRRNILILICLFASAVSTFGAAVAPSGGLSVVCMTVTFLLLGMALSNVFTLPLVIVPLGMTGTAWGIVNTGAQVAGFSAPMLIGVVLDATNQNFAAALYLIVGMLVAGGVAASRIK